MNTLFPIIGLLAVCMAHAVTLEKTTDITLPTGSGEIIAFNHASGKLVSTRKSMRYAGVQVLDLAAPGQTQFIDLAASVELRISSVSSVDSHPEKAIIAVAIIPDRPLYHRGRVVLVDLTTQEVLYTFQTGYHPDCVKFSHDGKYILVACEGEFGSERIQTPGSLTVIDWARENAVDYPLPESYAEAGLRSPHGVGLSDLEPEYVSESGGIAYVTLQENNGLARFDLQTRQWLPVWDLGGWEINADVSDRDGAWGKAAQSINKRVYAIPQPDTLAAFSTAGNHYVAVANEGDNTAGVRVKHLGLSGPKLDPDYRKQLKQQYGVDPQHDSALGRLQVSPIDGDLDGDGDIDRLTAFSTRSFSILDGESGEMLFDSGDFFERQSLSDPATHNWDLGRSDQRDSRSDNRGPEPEAIAFGHIFNVPHLAVSTERQGAIYLYRLDDPAAPLLVASLNESRLSHNFSAESMLLIPAAESPTNIPILVCAWEATHSISIYQIKAK
jgi:DNA-binding beta-propeller fold protein YncE